MSPSATPATPTAAASRRSTPAEARHRSQPSAIRATPATQKWKSMSPSSKPATWNEGGCLQVPRLPRQQLRRPGVPLRPKRATGASPVPYVPRLPRKSGSWCHQVPRLPQETKVDVSKCQPKRATGASPVPYVPRVPRKSASGCLQVPRLPRNNASRCHQVCDDQLCVSKWRDDKLCVWASGVMRSCVSEQVVWWQVVCEQVVWWQVVWWEVVCEQVVWWEVSCVWASGVMTSCVWASGVMTSCVCASGVMTSCVWASGVMTSCVWASGVMTSGVMTSCVWASGVMTRCVCVSKLSVSKWCDDKLCVSKWCDDKLCVSKLCDDKWYDDKLCDDKWCDDKLCVSKWCDDKWRDDKWCVSKWCDDKLCECEQLCVRRREDDGRRRRRTADGGIQNQKQEPHTKMWGKNGIWAINGIEAYRSLYIGRHGSVRMTVARASRWTKKPLGIWRAKHVGGAAGAAAIPPYRGSNIWWPISPSRGFTLGNNTPTKRNLENVTFLFGTPLLLIWDSTGIFARIFSAPGLLTGGSKKIWKDLMMKTAGHDMIGYIWIYIITLQNHGFSQQRWKLTK